LPKTLVSHCKSRLITYRMWFLVIISHVQRLSELLLSTAWTH